MQRWKQGHLQPGPRPSIQSPGSSEDASPSRTQINTCSRVLICAVPGSKLRSETEHSPTPKDPLGHPRLLKEQHLATQRRFVSWKSYTWTCQKSNSITNPEEERSAPFHFHSSSTEASLHYLAISSTFIFTFLNIMFTLVFRYFSKTWPWFPPVEVLETVSGSAPHTHAAATVPSTNNAEAFSVT